VELETVGTQTKHCCLEDIEAQNEGPCDYSKGTQTEQCPLKNDDIQTERPCILSMETQTNFPTIDVVIQTNFEEKT